MDSQVFHDPQAPSKGILLNLAYLWKKYLFNHSGYRSEWYVCHLGFQQEERAWQQGERGLQQEERAWQRK